MAIDPKARSEIEKLIEWCRQSANEVSKNRPRDPKATGTRYAHELIARLAAVGLGVQVKGMKPTRWTTIERIVAFLTEHAERLECMIRYHESPTFDIPVPDSSRSVVGAIQEGHESGSNVQGADHLDLSPFSGGTIVFFQDRVELCGVDICSGPRCATRRAILDLLRLKMDNGTYIAYSGDKLAHLVEKATGHGTIGRAISDLRDDIVERLRNQGNINCGREDVILSRGSGYRFAECIRVQHSPEVEAEAITDITDTEDVSSVHDVRDADVNDVSENTPENRQRWILAQLKNEKRLNADDVAARFSCQSRTAHRDFASLKEAGKIEFVGPARTGHYRLRQADDSE